MSEYKMDLILKGISAIIAFLIMLIIISAIALIIKKFIFSIIDHAKGTDAQTKASKKDYTAEARGAYESVTPKRKRDEKPPWEE